MLKNMNKNKILIALVVLLAVALLAVVFHQKIPSDKKSNSVVYLATGEIYVGKLSTFPRMTMTDGYIFQAVKDPTDPTKSNFQINPLKDALWAPTKIYINQSQVLFYGPLSDSSKIATTLAQQAK